MRPCLLALVSILNLISFNIASAQVQRDVCAVRTWVTSSVAQIEGGYGRPIWNDSLTEAFVRNSPWQSAYQRLVVYKGSFYSTGRTFTYMAMEYDQNVCGEIRTDTRCMKPIGKYFTNGKRIDLWALRSHDGYWNTPISLTGICMHYTGY